MKKRKEEGFTIIEVMIVLAIAGVIILIVFLAVPALQRNNRNTQRNNDAGKVVALVNECMANHNGIVGNCLATNIGFDSTKMSILTGVSDGSATPGGDTAAFSFGFECDPAGTQTAIASSSTKSFAVFFSNESPSGPTPRCVSS